MKDATIAPKLATTLGCDYDKLFDMAFSSSPLYIGARLDSGWLHGWKGDIWPALYEKAFAK